MSILKFTRALFSFEMFFWQQICRILFPARCGLIPFKKTIFSTRFYFPPHPPGLQCCIYEPDSIIHFTSTKEGAKKIITEDQVRNIVSDIKPSHHKLLHCQNGRNDYEIFSFGRKNIPKFVQWRSSKMQRKWQFMANFHWRIVNIPIILQHGWTYLHLAVRNGQIDMVEKIMKNSVEFGFDLNAKDSHLGLTAFHHTCSLGKVKIAELFIDN